MKLTIRLLTPIFGLLSTSRSAKAALAAAVDACIGESAAPTATGRTSKAAFE
jgi:hypothetical protein